MSVVNSQTLWRSVVVRVTSRHHGNLPGLRPKSVEDVACEIISVNPGPVEEDDGASLFAPLNCLENIKAWGLVEILQLKR